MAIPVAAPTSAAPRRLVLETPAGPHLLEPGSGALTLGRSLENDLIFDSPSVSRNHARLIPQGAHWLVEDMGSKHGVFVNDRRIISGLLRPGDRLRLGRLTLPVRRDGDAGPSDSPRGGASDDSGSATP
jgi:pSer/pThr/pTyr-binding forkhead associated (FHA) protein